MLLDFYFSNAALYQASVIVFRGSSFCSKERYLNLTKMQNQVLYMFDVVKKNSFVSLSSKKYSFVSLLSKKYSFVSFSSNYCFITITMVIRMVDFRNQSPSMTWQRYRLKVLRSSVGSIQTALWHHCIIIFFVVVFLRFLSRTDRFFNLSCHLFSDPFCLKQTSSFTKIIFFFFFFLKKIRRGKKIICSCFKSLKVKTIFWATFVDQLKVVSLHLMYKWDLHFYLVLFISFFSSKFHVCKVLSVNTFLCILGCFFSLCVIWVLWTFQLWKCYRTRVWCYNYLQSVLYLWQWLSIHNFM